MTPSEHQIGFMTHLKKREMTARKTDLQDVKVLGVRPALKDKELRPQRAVVREGSNEAFFSCNLPKMTTLHLLRMTRSLKTIPLGSSSSTTGKNKARALRKVGSQTWFMTRAMNSLLPTLTSTLALLLHQVPGTAGNHPGMTARCDTPVRLIGRSSRAMTGRFSRIIYTSLDLATLKLLRDIPSFLTW